MLDEYLKPRAGRTLSLDEINHVGAGADSLAFTIEQMGEARAASTFPWKPTRVSLYRTSVPHMADWLPGEELRGGEPSSGPR